MFVYEFSQAGTKHRDRGVGNQDAVRMYWHGNRAMAFVADGLGSCELGGQAAQAAVDAAARVAPWLFMPTPEAAGPTADLVVRAAFPAACNAIRQAALKSGANLDQLQTTLMAAVYDAGTGRLTFGHVGDGGLAVLLADGRVQVVTQTQKGDNMNQTLTVHDMDAWTFGEVHGVQAFALMTDGLFDRFCPGGTAAEGSYETLMLQRLFAHPRRLSEVPAKTSLDRVFAPDRRSRDEMAQLFDTVTDDRSIVLVSAASYEPVAMPQPWYASIGGRVLGKHARMAV